MNETPEMTALEAPPFSLVSADGTTVSLEDFRGKKNVVLVFNRGFF